MQKRDDTVPLMSRIQHLSPAEEAAALLVDVQRQALRGMVWATLAYLPIQLFLWHRTPLAVRSPSSLIIEAAFLIGVSAQFLAQRRLSIAWNGTIFLSWLGGILVLTWINSGPTLGFGVALLCEILIALFFIGRRAGAVVVLAFALLILVHAWLVQQGVFTPYPVIGAAPMDLSRLIIGGLSSFAVVAVAYVFFAMLLRGLFRTLERMTEERRNRDTAEAARLRAEETMRANQHFEALGKLSSGVAHDVNNALTAVLCNADLLRFTLPPGEAHNMVDDVLTAARSAAQTTRQLLSMSRRAFCQPASIDPTAELKTVSRLAARLLPENMWIAVEGTTSRRILVDPADLQQALLNLLLNARDAMPTGGNVVLRLEDATAADGSAQVVIRVRDSGTGIDPAVQSRIFDPFFTTKQPGHGTGLGLAMVKAFMEEAGGTIELTSAPGQGTTVSLRFPETHRPAPTVGAPEPAQPRANARRVLLIEDRDDLRELMERALHRGGYDVIACASCDEALVELDEGGHFDFLVTDGVGSRTPLLTVINRLRAADAGLPVLLCSGHADQELLSGGLTTLQVELLRKPFTGTELLTRVSQLRRPAA